jgi:drug/metabolite transporter (DMT)-like permease
MVAWCIALAMIEESAAAESGGQGTRALALAAVAGAVLTWGCSNVVIKLLSTTGIVSSFYRLWFAIPVLWLLPVLVPSTRRRLTRAWLRGSLIGGGLFALHQVLFFNSLKLTSVANVAIIGALQPALVLMVSGRVFGERVTRYAMLWSLVAVVGTALVIVGSRGTPSWSLRGDILAVFNLFMTGRSCSSSRCFRARSGTS